MKLSLCVIVKASDDEAKLLDRCLSYVAKHVDEVCLTITGENADCEAIAKKYQAKVSHFEWVKDFAAARNYNFSQATGDYILWLDCDDVLRGGEKLKGLVEKMAKERIDAVVMNYLYDFNADGVCTVKHLKTRVVKNDGCVRWVGALHEDFENTRELLPYLCEEIEVLHLTSEKRGEASAARNLDIALNELKEKPEDPRSLWLVSAAYQGVGEYEKAVPYLKRFIEASGSDEEKYLANLALSDISKGEDKKRYCYEAMTLRPVYPNAYTKLGNILKDEGKLDQARGFLEIALQLPRPERDIIVYNPREYDYIPMMLLLDIAFEKGEYTKALATLDRLIELFPKDENLRKRREIIRDELGEMEKVDEYIDQAEKIKDKAKLKDFLDALPLEVKEHPKMCFFRNTKFIKTESSGKDLVYYCSFTSKTWSPKKTDVGGSEEAVINLTRELAKLGWNVTVYNNCGKDAGVYDGVEYKPFWAFNVRDKQDVTIYWRHPKFADYHENGGKIFIDLHDVIPPGEFTKERKEKITGFFVKSEAHKKVLGLEKAFVVPNGINAKQFEKQVKKNPYLILNTSSPDRHLDATLDIFEELIKREPEKPWKLAWYYGWGNFDSFHADNKEMMEWRKVQDERFQKLVKAGRAEGGVMLDHEAIAKKYLEAGVFLYPTQFYEIDCISARKAQAAGCQVITSDFAALKETVRYGIRLHTSGSKWGKGGTFGDSENLKNYVEVLKNKDSIDIRGGVEWAKDFEWKEIANKWNKALCQ